MTELPIYKLDRLFNAPRDMVWTAWTDPDYLSRWYGPGIETIIHEFDLKPGGVWRNEMRWTDKSGNTVRDLSQMTFQEVSPRDKITWHHASVDENWELAPNQMMPDWPKLLDTSVIFTDKADGTMVTLTQVPIDATEAEIACFAKMKDGMSSGWGAGYKIIDEILVELGA